MGSLEWKQSCRKSHLGKSPWNKGKTRSSDLRVAKWLESSRLGHLGQIPWNKGKTKETDFRIVKSIETRKKTAWCNERNGLVTCKLCGQKFRSIAGPHLRIVHNIDMKRYLERFPDARVYIDGAKPRKGRVITWGNKISEAKKGVPSTRSKESYSKKAREMWGDLAHKEKMSRIQGELWKNPEYQKKMLEAGGLWGRGNMEEHRLKLAKAQKKLWADPNHRNRIVKLAAAGSTIHPNKPERLIQQLLDKLQPDQWRFNDGWFILAGKIPDFVNTNGVKKLIELFGTYWHERDEEQPRKELFGQYGYETLVVWEDELSDIDALILRLRGFITLTGSKKYGKL